MRTEAFAALVTAIHVSPVELTLQDLIDRLEPVADGTLGKIFEIQQALEMFNVEAAPSWMSGEIATNRLLKIKNISGEYTEVELRSLIAKGESAALEFKGSLLFDMKKAQSLPGQKPSDYRSEAVQLSTLKTIAAFLNGGGGTLLVGVADDQQIVGVEHDYCFAETKDKDHWELHLRNCIGGKFKDGASVNDYVRVELIPIDDKTVAKIDVVRRKKLCVLKDTSGTHRIYRRQGNRTDNVDMCDIEEFLESRRNVPSDL